MRSILLANADANSLQMEPEAYSSLGGRPALLMSARYAKGGKPLQARAYLTFSRSIPVYLFLIAGADDAMDWCRRIAEAMEVYR